MVLYTHNPSYLEGLWVQRQPGEHVGIGSHPKGRENKRMFIVLEFPLYKNISIVSDVVATIAMYISVQALF
jgi:hypothetical protein